MPRWVFYSSKTGKTARLMDNAGLAGIRLQDGKEAHVPQVDEPFILLTPSFGDGYGKGDVPKAVIRFLNNPVNRSFLRAVVSTGDRNFNAGFARAGDVISAKCNVPLLCRIEREGTSRDWEKLQAIDHHFQQTPYFIKQD